MERVKLLGLGIEATAHTFGVGITDDEFNIKANIQKTYIPVTGGIHPREAVQHHLENADKAIKEALKSVKIDLSDLDFIAFSQGPGLA